MRRLFSRFLLVALVAVAAVSIRPAPAAAFQSYKVNTTTYPFPDVDDTDWGQQVTDWALAVSTTLSAICQSTASINLFQANTNYIGLDGSTQSKKGTIFAFQLAASSATFNLLRVDSITVNNVIVATNGFIGGSSTFTSVNSSTYCWNRICYNMPMADGLAGQALVTNGFKSLSFTTIGGAGGTALTFSNSGVNGSTVPAAVGSSITAQGGIMLYQPPGGSVTIRDSYNIQYATGLLWKYSFREISTGTFNAGTYRIYDTVLSTRYGVVGQGCMTSSTMGINNGNGIHTNYTGAGATISIASPNLTSAVAGSSGKITVETWVKFDKAAAGNEDFIEMSAGAQAGWYFRRTATQQLTFTLTDSGATQTTWTSTACLNAGSWHHIACWYDQSQASGKAGCFVDGNTMSNAASDGAAIGSPAGILNIGAADGLNRATGAWFGLIACYEWPFNKATANIQMQAGIVREP